MASAWVSMLIVILLGIIAVIVTILVVVRLLRNVRRIDVPPNAPIIDNTARRHFTDGYAFGLVRRERPAKNGNVLVEYFPLDPEQGEGKPLPNIQSVVVGREFLKRSPRGDSSSRREIIRAVARNPADLPPSMRGTREGEWWKAEGQLAYLEKVFGRAIPLGDDAIASQMSDWNRGHISRDTMARIKEVANEVKKFMPSVDMGDKGVQK